MPAVNRYYSSVAVDTTLKFSITSSDTSLEVNSTAGFPTSYPYTLALGFDLSNEELVTIIGASGNILTVGTSVAGGANISGRGVDGTNDQSHAAGEPVKHVISARDMTEAQAHIAAEAGAHGITGSFVGTTDTQTLTNKTITGGTVNSTTLQQGGVPAVTTTGTQTLTNKTLTSPVITDPTISGTITGSVVTSANIVDGTIVNADINASAAIVATKLTGTTAEFNAALSDGDFATTAGTQTLTNKTLTSPAITGGTINGGAALTVDSTELNILDGVTASAAELNVLDGIPATLTATELGYVDGVTSAIQPQIDGKSETSHTHAYLPTSGGTVSGDVTVTGIVSAVTNTAAGRGLNVRQPSGNSGDAIIQFTNNAGSSQLGAINANSAGAVTVTSTTAYWPAVRLNTVSATANVVASSDYQLRIATSSARYKKDIEDLDHAIADSVLNLRPVWFRSKESSVDDTEQYSHVGLIAEEVAEIQPRLVFFNTVEPTLDEHGNLVFDENGQQQFTTLETPTPEGVNYDKLGVYLLDIIKREKVRSNDLEQRLITLEAKVAELEAK